MKILFSLWCRGFSFSLPLSLALEILIKNPDLTTSPIWTQNVFFFVRRKNKEEQKLILCARLDSEISEETTDQI